MNAFNPTFFHKYQEIKGVSIPAVDGFVSLHETLGGKTIYAYLSVDAAEIDRTFLLDCSADERRFAKEFPGRDFAAFSQSEFIFKDEASFTSYKAFLEYHKIEAVLFDTHFDEERKILELCKIMICTKSAAKEILDASTGIDTVQIVEVRENEDEKPKKTAMHDEIPGNVRLLSEMLIVLNKLSINVEIQDDELFGYTSYAQDTHKKFAPKIVDFFLEMLCEVKEINEQTIKQILEKFDELESLNIESIILDPPILTEPKTLSSSHKFWKKRFKDVEPILLACEGFFKAKCEERKNYIAHHQVEAQLQDLRDVFTTVMDVISDFVDDKTYAIQAIDRQMQDSNLIFAAQIYIVTVRLKSVNEYLQGLLSQASNRTAAMQRIATDINRCNGMLLQIKGEYDAAYLGEKLLSEMKGYYFIDKQKRKEKDDEIKTQDLIINNLKKYCRT